MAADSLSNVPATDPSSPSIPATPTPLKVTTRHATPSDLPAISSWLTAQMINSYCHVQKIGAMDHYVTPQFADEVRAARAKTLANPRCITLVAYAGDQIVGLIEFGPTRWYADLEGKCDSRWEIWVLYTSDVVRGTRLDTRLIQEALRIMMQLDKRPEDEALQVKLQGLQPQDFIQERDACVVLTLEGNSARRFYSKLGAKHKWDCPNYPAGGQLLRVVAYEFDWTLLSKLADFTSSSS